LPDRSAVLVINRKLDILSVRVSLGQVVCKTKADGIHRRFFQTALLRGRPSNRNRAADLESKCEVDRRQSLLTVMPGLILLSSKAYATFNGGSLNL